MNVAVLYNLKSLNLRKKFIVDLRSRKRRQKYIKEWQTVITKKVNNHYKQHTIYSGGSDRLINGMKWRKDIFSRKQYQNKSSGISPGSSKFKIETVDNVQIKWPNIDTTPLSLPTNRIVLLLSVRYKSVKLDRLRGEVWLLHRLLWKL